MAGREVTRVDLDYAVVQALVDVRKAFEKVETVSEFLATQTLSPEGVDPLTASTEPTDPMDLSTAPGKFGYNEDEAYLIRLVFDQLTALAVQPIIDTGRKLTGLE